MSGEWNNENKTNCRVNCLHYYKLDLKVLYYSTIKIIKNWSSSSIQKLVLILTGDDSNIGNLSLPVMAAVSDID